MEINNTVFEIVFFFIENLLLLITIPFQFHMFLFGADVGILVTNILIIYFFSRQKDRQQMALVFFHSAI